MRFANPWAIATSFFRGGLRRQFYADTAAFSEASDATRQIGAGYVCLAGSLGWLTTGLLVLILNPAHIAAHLVALFNTVGCYYGFRQIQLRKDPRPAMGVMVLSAFVGDAIMSFHHSGLPAPCLAALPVITGLAVFYLRGRMRALALAVGLASAIVCFLSATGAIGLPTTYSKSAYSAMMFLSLVLSMVCFGGIAWIANMSRDYAIAKLEAARDEIVQSAARSHVAMEAAKVGLWDVPNMQERKFHVSESFETITGYTADEFNELFSRMEDFIHPDDIAGLREAFALGRKRLSRMRIDFRLMTRSRGYRWFSARAKHAVNPDGSLRISGSLQDINFIKAAEDALRAGRDRAREANKAKSDFIAIMSHEVRTPLNAILGSVEVLKRGEHGRESNELIHLIDDAGRGLLAMVNDMLDVSKIEAGKIEVAPTATDLSLLVTRTVEFWRPQAASKGLQLTVDCREVGERNLVLDPVRVRQIVGNLISNAVKFTDEGVIATRASTHERPDGQVDVVISVIDNGPGVPDAIAETIFAPFEQTPAGHGRGGTGLGLFISRRLARMMGGDVTLEPARENGAHFRVAILARFAAPEIVAATDTESDPLWTGKRILCVDDNEKNRRIAELLLGKFGLDVTSCASGAEAIDLCGVDLFDLILMDIVMPEMDGVETLRRLRTDENGLNRQTPAIALTAKLTPEDIAGYAAVGFEGVAAKPINVSELARAIEPFMLGGFDERPAARA
ncbi:MAG: response regulator [Alphaproteobacteria bacterium]|nr:response regulator [Alphaproteobacteria bacterium]